MGNGLWVIAIELIPKRARCSAVVAPEGTVQIISTGASVFGRGTGLTFSSDTQVEHVFCFLLYFFFIK